MHTPGERPTKIQDQNHTFSDSFSQKKTPKQQDIVLAHTKLSRDYGIRTRVTALRGQRPNQARR